MEEERTFDVMETVCFPKGCLIPRDTQILLAVVLIPKLEADGLTMPQWTRGAGLHEEPYFTKVKAVVCKGCGMTSCEFNTRYRPSNELSYLLHGQYHDRMVKGDELVAQLLPEEKKQELEAKGVKCYASSMPSRRNPRLFLTFKRDSQNYIVDCEVGKGVIRTNANEEKLLSFEQLSRKIDEVTRSFA